MVTSDYDTFSKLRQRIKCSMNYDWSAFAENAESQTISDSQHFWRYVRSIRNDGAIPSAMKHGELVIGGEAISSCFADIFQTNYSTVCDDTIPNDIGLSSQFSIILESIPLSPEEIFEAILFLKPRNLTGPSLFFIDCSFNLVEPLFYDF